MALELMHVVQISAALGVCPLPRVLDMIGMEYEMRMAISRALASDQRLALADAIARRAHTERRDA
jgi:hypothetical protein